MASGLRNQLERIPRAPRVLRALAHEKAETVRALSRTALARMDRSLERAAAKEGPIVVGPWLSEVGFEVLYWIPFLNWAFERNGIGPERVVAVSRGGSAPWYAHIAAEYRDVFDWFAPHDLKATQECRVRATRSQKQLTDVPFEREVLARVTGTLDREPAGFVGARLMYNPLMPFWAGRRGNALVESRSRFRPLPRPPRSGLLDDLPDNYVAVKGYFSECLPDTDGNRAFVHGLLTRLLDVGDVVLLSTGIDLDDHHDIPADATGRLHDLSYVMTPRNNLAVQTEAIAGARALFGTYGGFSYLGPFLGVPSLAFFSWENFIPQHLNVMDIATKRLRKQGVDAAFTAMHVRQAQVLESLLLERARAK